MSLYIFQKTFNPLSVYATIWFFLITLYEIRLINYDQVSIQVWVIIVGAYFSFFVGILIPFLTYGPHKFDEIKKGTNSFHQFYVEKIELIKYFIIFFSLLGLAGTIQHWLVLLRMYGSIPEVLINSTKTYSLRVAGELEGVIPYIAVSTYIAIFLVAIYIAYRKKFSLLTFIPLISVILKGIASVGRQGILYGFLEFLTTFIVGRYYFSQFEQKKKKNKKNLILLVVFAVLFFFSATLIKDFRGSDESYTGETRTLKSLQNNMFFSPSVYFYLSADVGVLNKYFEKGVEENRIGENTFQLVYNIFAKLGLTERAISYQKGYYIPEWVNTGTYLREIDADFGTIGIYIIPFLLGFFSFYNWYFFMKKGNPIYLIFLVHLWIIIWFSFLMMITRGANWFLGIGILNIVFYILNNTKKTKLSQQK